MILTCLLLVVSMSAIILGNHHGNTSTFQGNVNVQESSTKTTCPTHDLVNIHDINKNIILDIRYATPHNFTGVPVYTRAVCYVRKAVAKKLDAAQKELELVGVGLKIYDGYRPLSVQKIFWQHVPDERYVMPPSKGSRHNRGAAVDVTLVDSNGKELPMPTEFDDFTEKAHRTYMNLPEEVLRNRKYLEDCLHKHGFIGLPTEWWHFDSTDWHIYEILDYSLEELEEDVQ